MKRLLGPVGAAALLALPHTAWAASPFSVLAAENVYGDVAQQIGGADVAVTSILNNPDQDPHMFEVSAAVARAVAAARIVVANGIDYDPWMQHLLAATRGQTRRTIVVATLAGRKAGDNPHLWYDTAVMRTYATALARDLAASDPAHAADYDARLGRFRESLIPIERKIADIRTHYAGTRVTATEPVFGLMFETLGMLVSNMPFQMAVMNDTEPTAAEVAAFEDDLRGRKVRLLLYNSQATDALATRMATLARAARIPVVAVTETEPRGVTYQAWMLRELEAVERALAD